MGAFNFISKQNNLLILKKTISKASTQKEYAFNSGVSMRWLIKLEIVKNFLFSIPTFIGT